MRKLWRKGSQRKTGAEREKEKVSGNGMGGGERVRKYGNGIGKERKGEGAR